MYEGSKMSEKVCIKCSESKPLSEYYRHKQMADGYLHKCKECCKSDAKKNREQKAEHYREYDKHRYQNDPKVKARNRRYAQSDAGKIAGNRAKKKWAEQNPIKRSASLMVNNAVRDGKLEKPDACDICGHEGRIHGHHDDYAKPLEVRWLCSKCHESWHRKNGEGLNAF